ncbi:hypothetical protein MES4922_110077 [Mesorhizobium ventifaucium]|jgi:hypothetical protein|uniref:Propionyl-coenzyme A carboxylase alpha polypeptide n=1 Tax=Mesorhizobium ventifaucium TaxID=666020 RepID=A0ABM9DDS2_9HYPH|nr:hypothetical protein MES4922_110077 [Mesorhizobium ventifaucium]
MACARAWLAISPYPCKRDEALPIGNENGPNLSTCGDPVGRNMPATRRLAIRMRRKKLAGADLSATSND